MSEPQDAAVADPPSLQPSPSITPEDNPRESPEANHSENGKPEPPSSSGVPAQENSMISPIRDPEYYFEDGNMILLVGNILFKVHASLVKAQSEMFTDMFTISRDGANGLIEGTCDKHPIVIPEVEPSQFRNLMKVFYCSPSTKFSMAMHTCVENGDVWQNLRFYLDVASLSHRFAMSETEEWSGSQLSHLVLTAAKNTSCEHFEEGASCFMDALWYARTISNPDLVRTIRNMIEYFCQKPDKQISPEKLISLLRIPNLRERDPSLFGYLFTLLLSYGHQIWKQDIFTKADRMAFFSAQSYLTPLPGSLKKSLDRLFSVKQVSLKDFSQVCSSKNSQNCATSMFLEWLEVFDNTYYSDVKSRRALVAVKALATLPLRRLKLADKFEQGNCQNSSKALEQLDIQLEQLYARLADYYQDIE